MAYRSIVHTMRNILQQTLKAQQETKTGSGTFHRVSSVVPYLAKDKVILSWRKQFRTFQTSVNDKLTIVMSLFSKQCSAIIAQRIRRTLQMVTLYRRLGYDGSVAKRMCNSLLSRAIRDRRGTYMLLGAVLFSWDTEKITDEEIDKATREMDLVESPADKGLKSAVLESWQQLINKDHLQVWRKPLSDCNLYEYKVMGRYRDIPARAFFQAQVDVEYRKSWDKLVIKVDVIDRDEVTGCEVVHWVTHYPYPMYGREYVYIRKAFIDTHKNLMVLMSRATEHPLCPATSQYVRVDHYLSHMVIKPHTTFDENGFDYILTYYDNPKGSFPSFAYNWMASTGVPDFVDKMHSSAVRLHERRTHLLMASDDEEDECEQEERQKIPM